jgi:hypothetical protein
MLLEGDLYRRGTNGVLAQCITREEGCELLAVSLEASVGTTHLPAHWSVMPFGMASIGLHPSMMPSSW